MIARMERHALPHLSAKIVPYPLARRRDLVAKIAAQVLARSPTLGEEHLQRQLRRQDRYLSSKGAAETAIKRELRALEAAVRTELWLIVLAPDPPDGAA
jgi:hypothetical protein